MGWGGWGVCNVRGGPGHSCNSAGATGWGGEGWKNTQTQRGGTTDVQHCKHKPSTLTFTLTSFKVLSSLVNAVIWMAGLQLMTHRPGPMDQSIP